MLGPKEICGLIVFLCCSLASAAPHPLTCEGFLWVEAEKLESDTKNLISMPENAMGYSTITAALPSCDGHSQNELRSLVYAFYTLFQELNETVVSAASVNSLSTNLQQQEVCLRHWQVFRSHISITNEETDDTNKKIFLVKAFERYLCLMRKLRDETSDVAAEDSR